ncbi:unnamed protein product [Effrenium voratum]|nr:unnamed protein product [Effrenium voratum]
MHIFGGLFGYEVVLSLVFLESHVRTPLQIGVRTRRPGTACASPAAPKHWSARRVGGWGVDVHRVRETRAKAVRAVRPWIELLAEPRQCREVRQAMEIMLQETREEYNTTLSMKTAKAEVVQELQDRSSQQEWMIKQLQDAVELLEDSQLCTATAAMDLELFFLDALGSPMPQELCTRAGGCLRALVRCGRAAACFD